MKNLDILFRQMSDTAVITDAYGYVLDFNRNDKVTGLKKGLRLTKLIPDMFTQKEGNIEIGDYVYSRIVSPVSSGNHTIGYTVIFMDVTEEVILERQNKDRGRELRALTQAKSDANQKLAEYALEVKNLSDYAEQLRIARSIHDDSGHAVTEIHTICQMCLQLMDKDIQAYRELIEEGIDICRRALAGGELENYSSLRELAETFFRRGSIEHHVSSEGEEPAFMKEKYETVSRILKEAYHNTMEHSLGDAMEVKLEGNIGSYTVMIRDNGSFRGPLEKGFGLMAMEEYVRASGGEIRFLTEEGKGFGIVVTWRGHEGED
ncbi:MAG: hypothetical protein IKO03_05025 [Lachnospiraceae bacterium]|nr:hypothetical protein [Lachnospiraceae bacterium]